jgi:hypothetical protein
MRLERFKELDELISQEPDEPEPLDVSILYTHYSDKPECIRVEEATIRKILYDFCVRNNICTKCRRLYKQRGLLCTACADRNVAYTRKSRNRSK